MQCITPDGDGMQHTTWRTSPEKPGENHATPDAGVSVQPFYKQATALEWGLTWPAEDPFSVLSAVLSDMRANEVPRFSREARYPGRPPAWTEVRVKLEWTEVVRAEGLVKRLSSAVVMCERPRVAGSRKDSRSRSSLLHHHQQQQGRADAGEHELSKGVYGHAWQATHQPQCPDHGLQSGTPLGQYLVASISTPRALFHLLFFPSLLPPYQDQRVSFPSLAPCLPACLPACLPDPP
jgi:hypothetical protein